MMKIISSQSQNRFIIAALCLVLAVLSFSVAGRYMRSADRYSHTIESLDDKRSSVMEMSAALMGISVAVAAVPGDATTPIANQISELNSKLVVVLGAIMLEKFLLSIIAMAVFQILIPIAFILFAIYLVLDKRPLAAAGIYLVIFSTALMLMIPTGVYVGNMIDASYGTKDLLERIKEDVSSVDSESASSSSSESAADEDLFDIIGSLGRQISQTASVNIEKFKNIISDLMDAVAVLLVTTCVIPIVTLIGLVWTVKYGCSLCSASFQAAKDPRSDKTP